jgi:hypothetical protein
MLSRSSGVANLKDVTILNYRIAGPLAAFCAFVLTCMLLSGGRSPAGETEDAAVAKTNEIGIATLCRFLLGSGKLAAIETQPSGDMITVAVSDDTGKLYVSRGRGGQWRSRSVQLDISKRPRLRLVDLDGDGEYELIVVSKRLRIYSTLDGIRQLWSSPELFDDVRPPAVEVLDFDQDGRKEIVVLNYKRRERPAEEASVFVFRQDTSSEVKQSLISTMTLQDEHDYHSTAGLAIGDFEGTGIPQLVVGNDNGFLWLIDFKEDRLELHHAWKVPSGGAVGSGLAAGDLDGRPGAELLVGTNGGDLFVFGFDRESVPKLQASAKAGRLAYGVTAGDFDGNGSTEFGLARGHAGYAGMTERDVVAEVWQLEGEKLERIWQHETLDAPRAIVRDLDGDGRDEMIIYSLTDHDIAVVKPTR